MSQNINLLVADSSPTIAQSKAKFSVLSPSLQHSWRKDAVLVSIRVTYSMAVLLPNLDFSLTKFNFRRESSLFSVTYPADLAWNLATRLMLNERFPLARELRWNGWYLAAIVQSGHEVSSRGFKLFSRHWHQTWISLLVMRRNNLFWSIDWSHLSRRSVTMRSETGNSWAGLGIFFSNLEAGNGFQCLVSTNKCKLLIA